MLERRSTASPWAVPATTAVVQTIAFTPAPTRRRAVPTRSSRPRNRPCSTRSGRSTPTSLAAEQALGGHAERLRATSTTGDGERRRTDTTAHDHDPTTPPDDLTACRAALDAGARRRSSRSRRARPRSRRHRPRSTHLAERSAAAPSAATRWPAARTARASQRARNRTAPTPSGTTGGGGTSPSSRTRRVPEGRRRGRVAGHGRAPSRRTGDDRQPDRGHGRGRRPGGRRRGAAASTTANDRRRRRRRLRGDDDGRRRRPPRRRGRPGRDDLSPTARLDDRRPGREHRGRGDSSSRHDDLSRRDRHRRRRNRSAQRIGRAGRHRDEPRLGRLAVPTSAITTQGTRHTVRVLDGGRSDEDGSGSARSARRGPRSRAG